MPRRGLRGIAPGRCPNLTVTYGRKEAGVQIITHPCYRQCLGSLPTYFLYLGGNSQPRGCGDSRYFHELPVGPQFQGPVPEEATPSPAIRAAKSASRAQSIGH